MVLNINESNFEGMYQRIEPHCIIVVVVRGGGGPGPMGEAFRSAIRE